MNFKKSFLLCFFISSSFYLYSSNTITITNSSRDSVSVSIKFSINNLDTVLYDAFLKKNETKILEIPKTDTIIGRLDFNFSIAGESYLPAIVKKTYCHNSDITIKFNDFHPDSILLENSIEGIHPKSIDLMQAICMINNISFVLQKDISTYGMNVPDPYKVLDFHIKYYLTSEVVDLFKLRKLYDYCSFSGNEYISKEDLEKQMKRFDISKWTYLYEYKRLKAYLEALNSARETHKFDYYFINEKKQEEKLLSNSKKIKVYVFWANPCGKITCYPYFEKLIAWKKKLKKIDFTTISSETTHDEWLRGLARCSLKSWKNYRNPNESMAPMAINYQIANVYQSFLVLGKNNETLLNTTDYEKLNTFFSNWNEK